MYRIYDTKIFSQIQNSQIPNDITLKKIANTVISPHEKNFKASFSYLKRLRSRLSNFLQNVINY